MFQLEIFGAISAMVGIKMLPLVVSLRKITWLNSQQPKTGEHVEHRSNTSFFLQLYDILQSAVRYCKNISTTYINPFSIQISIPNVKLSEITNPIAQCIALVPVEHLDLMQE